MWKKIKRKNAIILSEVEIDELLTCIADRECTLDHFFEEDLFGEDDEEERAIILRLRDLLEEIKYDIKK